MTKWLSRNVIYNGRKVGLAVVTVNDDETVSVEPFICEQAGVKYTDCSILIESQPVEGVQEGSTHNHHHLIFKNE